MDLRLHALIDQGRVPEGRLEPFLREAAGGGVTVVQLREKEGSARAMLRYGEAARRIARELGLLFAVDDRLDLALALDADILHLGRDDLPWDVARRLAPGIALGLSAANPAGLQEALRASPAYVGYGPIFATPSKADAAPPVGPAGLGEAVRLAGGCPLVAIGGVTPKNAGEVWRAGASGIAVIAALTAARDVRAAAAALRQAKREGDAHVP
jgi:thiamine-phosphate pyrophosphorylase